MRTRMRPAQEVCGNSGAEDPMLFESPSEGDLADAAVGVGKVLLFAGLVFAGWSVLYGRGNVLRVWVRR